MRGIGSHRPAIFVLLLTLSGCGTQLRYLAKAETFTGTDSGILQEPRPDGLEIARQVGTSLDYYVTGFDQNTRVLSLGTHPNIARLILVGSVEQTSMRILLSEDFKGYALEITVSGEFHGGGAEDGAAPARVILRQG
jgi:hypothetical protein